MEWDRTKANAAYKRHRRLDSTKTADSGLRATNTFNSGFVCAARPTLGSQRALAFSNALRWRWNRRKTPLARKISFHRSVTTTIGAGPATTPAIQEVGHAAPNFTQLA